MSQNVLAYQLLKFANLPEIYKQMVEGTITSLNFNSMKDQLKKMFGESLPSIEKCPIKAEDTFRAQHAIRNHYKELYKSDFSDDKNANNKKHTLQVIPNDIWIGHLNHVNISNAGIQPTTHREDHINTHINAPQNNSSNTKEKVKIPETMMVALHAVQSSNL